MKAKYRFRKYHPKGGDACECVQDQSDPYERLRVYQQVSKPLIPLVVEHEWDEALSNPQALFSNTSATIESSVFRWASDRAAVI